jgi:hypothetical protein
VLDVVLEDFGFVVVVVDFDDGDAAARGPMLFRSPIWRSTMPMITATPMSTAPRNAAYPAPLATSPRPPPRCCRLIRSFCPLGAERRVIGSRDRHDGLLCAHVAVARAAGVHDAL